MNIKLLHRKTLSFLALLIAFGLIVGCSSDKDKSTDSDGDITIYN